jgi:hypothetical protein
VRIVEDSFLDELNAELHKGVFALRKMEAGTGHRYTLMFKSTEHGSIRLHLLPSVLPVLPIAPGPRQDVD